MKSHFTATEKKPAGRGNEAGGIIHRNETENREVIHLVDHSALSAKKTLNQLQVPRSPFYCWYKHYLEEGEAGLADHRPNSHHIWNIQTTLRDNGLPVHEPKALFHLRIQHLTYSEGL